MASPFPIPLNALRAIEIVARRGALSPAAEELGVTVGAVSQHLRRAEERLGVELFDRTSKGLVPTRSLTQILPQLREGFATLEGAMRGLVGTDDHVLTVTTASVYASRFLVWRLRKFSLLHPDIEVRMAIMGVPIDLHRPDIDCGVRFGYGVWPNTNAVLVGGTRYSPVAAPSIAAQLHTPADLARVPVIEDTATMLPWSAWFEAAGLAADFKTSGPVYNDPALAFDAAISEQGVLMAVDLMAADAISDGRLVRPFAAGVEDGLGYWLVTPAGRQEPRKVRLFREWLLAETRDSTLGYAEQARRVAEKSAGLSEEHT